MRWGCRRGTEVAALALLANAALTAAPVVAEPPSAKVTAEPDGPASAELRAMAKADQEDRKPSLEGRAPTKEEAERWSKNDAERLARVRQLLKEDKIVTTGDLDNAALLFQHGVTPDDYLVAHELTLIQMLHQPRRASNMLAISEDRFLLSIGRKQRFGGQSRGMPGGLQLEPVDEAGETAVTDTLRSDLFMPPLAASKQKGPMAILDYLDAIGQRARQRIAPARRVEQEARSESRALTEWMARAEREGTASEATVGKVLEWYRADKLVAPRDYAAAALLLMAGTSGRSAEVAADRCLLAHELAMVAALRQHPEGPGLAARSWDSFLVSAGLPQRYGTKPGAPRAETATSRVQKELLGAAKTSSLPGNKN